MRLKILNIALDKKGVKFKKLGEEIRMILNLCRGRLNSLRRKDKDSNPPKFAIANN